MLPIYDSQQTIPPNTHETSAHCFEPERTAAETRNHYRWQARNDLDMNIVGTLPPVLSIFDAPRVTPDDDSFAPSPWLLASIIRVTASPSTVPKPPPFLFRTDALALEHNAELLKEYDYDLSLLLPDFQDTTIAYGSEFRPIDDLRSVFGKHPNFEFFESTVLNGMTYHFDRELTEDERMAELEAQVLRGNHKSATSDPEGTDKMTGKDVKKGFSLPFPASIVTKIKQALVQPAGKVSQHSLTATGSRMLKDRLTHDLSFWLTEDYASVNSRCDFDKYPPIIYGSCLIRTIHYIVALRAAFPDERILISKFDFSDAYRRMAHDAAAAAQSILIVNHIAYLALRLSFGGAMNPAAWSCCSEMITDLSNELPLMEDWNPEEICSPDQHKVQAPIYESDQCAPAPAKPLSVHIPVTALGRSDCFIDDIIVVMIDRPEQILRHSSAAPLAIHCAMRPNAGVEKEPIPRRDAMAGEKLVAEGSPAESQICLGWTINTRLLLLLLPLDKFSAWSADIVDLLGRPDRVVTRPELETLIGRLNHASFVIPLSRHFLSNLRSKLKIRPRPNSRAKSKPKSNPSTEPGSTEPRPEPRSTEPRTDPSQAPIPSTASESSSDNRTVFQRVAGKVTSLVTKATSKTQFRWLRNQTYRLSDEDCSDLRLWLLLLEKAAKGISLNGLTMRNPTMLSVSDSCPFGLGGFTSNGSAWRLQVSESSPIYGNCISNNVLEFLAMVITIWLTLIECKEQGLKDELILALGDNTSAIGWMTKTGFLTPGSVYFSAANFIARKLASLMIESGNFLASQHLKGKKNIVADWLTFSGSVRSAEMNGGAEEHPLAFDSPSNDQLTHRLLRFCPKLLPPTFAISQLPTEILSFAQQSGAMLESSMMHKQRAPPKQSTEFPGGGRASAGPTLPASTPAFLEYQQTKPASASEPSLKSISTLILGQEEIFLEDVKSQWQAKQSGALEGHWRRRSGVMSGGRPCTVVA